MKLLHVITTMDPHTGGPCQVIRNQAKWFVDQGHNFEVVCLNEAGSDFLSGHGFPIHALGAGRGPWRYHPELMPWLRVNLPRFDAAILNGLWQYAGYALSKAAQLAGAPPYLVYPHGMLDPWFQRDPARRLKAVRNWCYWKFNEQGVIRRAEAVLFTCAEEMRLARHTFQPYQPKREVNVGLGVPPPPDYHPGMAEAFAKKCPGLNGEPHWLFLGRIHPKKGVDLLIKAYSALYRSLGAIHRATIPKLVIAGPGLENGFGKQLQELAGEICPPGSVLWPGMLNGAAKWGAVYKSEVFILTSHQENFGLAVVEAIACGKPVLISNQVNIWREIMEDQAGLVAPDTLEGAAQLFRRWESMSSEARTTMSHAAKISYEKRFGIDAAAQHLTAVLHDLTERRRNHSATMGAEEASRRAKQN
jgi:glycosyltransferase involved in cell wall biosynthesis